MVVRGTRLGRGGEKGGAGGVLKVGTENLGSEKLRKKRRGGAWWVLGEETKHRA